MKQEMGVIFPSYISQIDSMCWNGEETSGGKPGKACRRGGGMDVVRYYNLILTLFCGVFTM